MTAMDTEIDSIYGKLFNPPNKVNNQDSTWSAWMSAACAVRLLYKCYIHIIQNNVGRRQGRIQEGYYLLWWVQGQKQLIKP